MRRFDVLIVDDNPENIRLLKNVLQDENYRLRVALDGESTITSVKNELPDLILLDIMMPDMDGYEVCRRLKVDEKTGQIPIIFLSALESVADETKGLRYGAADYITKPFNAEIVKVRVRNQLMLKDYRDNLEELVSVRTEQLEKTQDAVIFSMGALAEYRDLETAKHIKRTQAYIQILAEYLLVGHEYSQELNPMFISQLCKSAPLHDIGKVGIPDNILLKPGKLTVDEFEQMKKHTVYGKEMIARTQSELKYDSYLRLGEIMAYCHHEKWDGTGYPEQLKGTEIPLSGRLMAIADVYDALISKRVYKDAMSHDEAKEIIVSESGKHFDPKLIDAFCVLEEQFNAIATLHSDE